MDFGKTQDSNKICEFIQKLLLMSQHLNNISAKQVENLYEIVVEDLKYKLPKKVQSSLFEMLQNIKKIDRVRLHAGDSEPDAIAIDQNNQQVYIKWDLKYQEDSKNLKEYALSHGSDTVYIFYIIDGEYKIENYKEGEHGQAYEQISLNKTPSDNQVIDLSSSMKKYDVKILTSEVTSVTSKGQESQKEIKRKERIEEVKKKLGDKKLHTDKAVEDYEEIPYVAFFERLITNPNQLKNKKWIGLFLSEISGRWKDEGLVTIREFFQEFPPQKKYNKWPADFFYIL